jgi:hypothetical protein
MSQEALDLAEENFHQVQKTKYKIQNGGIIFFK